MEAAHKFVWEPCWVTFAEVERDEVLLELFNKRKTEAEQGLIDILKKPLWNKEV